MPLDQNNKKAGKSDNPSARPAPGVLFQKTLKSSIGCTGVALHSGAKVNMTLHPADVDTGIVFRRTDIVKGDPKIQAIWSNVVDTRLCTVLGNDDGVRISTVEHLMAAFVGMGIDNVIVDVSGPEVPVMDGSSAPFLFLMECAGVVEQHMPRRAIRVLKAVAVDDDGKSATLLPAGSFSVDFEIDFESPAVSRQEISLDMADGAFKKELSRARTFGFMHEVEQLWAAGLAKGGSLENAVVVSGDRVLNEDGLRYDDEFVRHKVLDAVGDLYLAGGPILGRFSAVCTGHAANNALLRRLFADSDAWEWVDMTADVEPAPAPATDVAGEAIAATA